MKNNEIANRKKKIRVSASIDAQLHLLFKLACKEMGVSMESRIEFLISEDVKQSLKGDWFKGMISSAENNKILKK